MERKIGLFSAPRLFERLFAPRIPVHRIVRVLQQVRTLLVDQTIRMHEFLAFRAAGGDEQQEQWKRQRFDLDSHPRGRASDPPF